MAQVFNETDKQIHKLNKQKNTLPDKEYEKTLENILSKQKQQLKQIEKQYPIDKEVKKYLKEN